MTTQVLDTNILVRFLLKDHKTLSPQASALFKEAEKGKINFYADEIMVAEVIWLLDSFYKYSREEIINQLKEVICQPWIVNPRKELILATVELFGATNLSYIDCWLYAISQNLNFPLATFDRKLKKLKPSR